MSLFVGNISKHVKSEELESEFSRFGPCEIKRQVSNVSKRFFPIFTQFQTFNSYVSLIVLPIYQGSYAFIEYDSEKAAEEAIAQLNGVNLKGLEIGIEWSKRSSRYDPRQSRRPV